MQEIHRLAVLGNVAAIAQDVGPRLTGRWLATSRFREVRQVSLQTLALGPHARTLVDLARARQAQVRCKTHSNITAQPCISIQRWAARAGRPPPSTTSVGSATAWAIGSRR